MGGRGMGTAAQHQQLQTLMLKIKDIGEKIDQETDPAKRKQLEKYLNNNSKKLIRLQYEMTHK